VYLKYFIAWFPMFVIALANATIREVGYKRYFGELAAHQISTLTACILVGVYVWLLSNYLAIQSAGQAIGIGLMWLAMTVVFEFGFGHFIVGNPWSRLLHDYNVWQSRVWGLFVLWIAVAPYVFYEIRG
jgi:hypothetical protein